MLKDFHQHKNTNFKNLISPQICPWTLGSLGTGITKDYLELRKGVRLCTPTVSVAHPCSGCCGAFSRSAYSTKTLISPGARSVSSWGFTADSFPRQFSWLLQVTTHSWGQHISWVVDEGRRVSCRERGTKALLLTSIHVKPVGPFQLPKTVGWAEASAAIALQFTFSPAVHRTPYKCGSWDCSTINLLCANLWLRNQLTTTSKATSSKQSK